MILHFDAHRDMKREYDNMKMCHTTPFFHLISEGHIEGKDLIQIGIRQSDNQENMTDSEKRSYYPGCVGYS